MEVLEKINTTNKNEILFLAQKSHATNALNILFLGVTHGEEPQGEFLINKFIEKIQKEKLYFKNNLYFIPCLNPDGKQLKQRGNFNNIDLNRNFATKNFKTTTFDDGTKSGNKPQSEIETKFLSEIIEKIRFDIILSFHAPFEIVNFDGNAEEIAQKISEITGYPVQKDIGYPTPGSFGTFCGIERNIPTITLELSQKLSNQELWEQNKEIFNYLGNY